MTMRPSTYRIPLEVPGRLWIMPKPSEEWLADDIASYHLLGMSKIISLLTRDEAAELGLADEGPICRRYGLSFQQFPIPDRGFAADRAAFAALARETLDLLLAGETVGIHCRAGIGRSGMLACCVLALNGSTVEEAIAIVSQARGVPVPDTDAQTAYIRDIAGTAGLAVGTDAYGTSIC